MNKDIFKLDVNRINSNKLSSQIMLYLSFGGYELLKNTELLENKEVSQALEVSMVTACTFYLGSLASLIPVRSKIYKNYKEVINNYKELCKTLEVNDPVSLFETFYYSFSNGYLSYNKHFSFYSSYIDMIPSFFAPNVITGEAVCRNLGTMFRDILKSNNIDASPTVVNFIPKNSDGEFYNISDYFKSIAEDDNQLFSLISTLIGNFFGNHLITTVKYDNTIYGFDPTNHKILEINPKDIFYPYSCDNYNCKFPLFFHPFQKENWIFKNRNINTNIDKENIKRIQDVTLAKCEENNDLFEKFYQENKKLYKEIASLYSRSRTK